jgi:hypothetical protein
MYSGNFKGLFQRVCRKILSLPISSTEAERLFSIATDIFKDKRQNLRPESKRASVLFRYKSFLKILKFNKN